MRELIWESPSFVELRMDAEVGSYQDDFDPEREVPAFVGARGAEGPRDAPFARDTAAA